MSGLIFIPRYAKSATPPRFDKVTHIGGYSNQAFFVVNDGVLYGAGANSYGELGVGHTNPVTQLTPITNTSIGAMPRIRETYSYIRVVWLIAEDGRAFVAGNDISGRFGLGNSITAPFDSELQFKYVMAGVKKIRMYVSNTYILTTNGSLYCTGQANAGQYGGVTTTHQNTFIKIYSNVVDFDISTNGSPSVALIDSSGRFVVTGRNANNVLGMPNSNVVYNWTVLGTTSISGRGAKVTATTYSTVLHGNTATSYLSARGSCVGSPAGRPQYYLGLPGESIIPAYTSLASSIRNLGQISTSFGSGAIMSVGYNDDLWVCGENLNGCLGAGHPNPITTPTRIPSISGVQKIVSYGYTYSAVIANGNLYVAGNSSGRYGPVQDTAWTMVLEGGVEDIYNVSDSSYAIKDGKLYHVGQDLFNVYSSGAPPEASDWTVVT